MPVIITTIIPIILMPLHRHIGIQMYNVIEHFQLCQMYIHVHTCTVHVLPNRLV